MMPKTKFLPGGSVQKYKFELVAGVATAALQFGSQFVAQTAFAQSADDAPGLEEMVVTAQKREQNLQDVPIAIAAVSADLMEKMQITDLSTLVQAVPALQYSFAFSNPQFTLRGITNYSNGPWVESGVNIYIDGVYSANNQASVFSFNNVERVEVLKGPQGTLFGRNALGGVVSVTTKQPSHAPALEVEVGYGNFDTVSGKLYGATGIGENVAADIAVYAQKQSDGWGTNLYDNGKLHYGEEWAVRSKWVFTPGDATTITLVGDYEHTEPPVLGIATINGVYDFVNIGPVHMGGFWDSYLPDIGLLDVTKYGGALTIDHEFGWAELVSISGLSYSEVKKNATRPAAYPYNPQNPAQGQALSGFTLNALQLVDTKTITQEVQLKSLPSSTIKWIAGVFVLRDDIENLAYRAPITGALVYTDATQKTESYAGFGQVTVPLLSDATRLTLGFRYTTDRREIDGNTYTAAGVVIPASSVITNPEPKKTWKEPTYTAVIDRDLNDRIMAYASYSRGFQSGSYNISSSVNEGPVDPQTLDAFEIGLKTTLADNRLRLNTSAFYYKMHDLLVSQNIENVRITSNAAAAKYTGVDIDVTYLPIDDLTLTLGASYTEPEYSDYQDATYYRPNPNGNGTFVAFVGDATGNQIAYSEKFSASFSASYELSTFIGDLSLNAIANYHDGAHYDAQGLLVQPGYTVVNASLKWTRPGSSWDVRLWSNNLLNEEYASTLFANTPVMYMNPSPPRTYGIEFGYRY
jgi:iron complex outermembrane receptor protein